jgi:hypothetical protein
VGVALDYWGMNPAWRFNLLELVDPFGWHVLDEKKLREIRQKLAGFESMTMSQIFVANRSNNHPVKFSDLCGDAQERLWKLNLESTEEIHSLRLSGAERVWAIRELNVLNLLWWDPDHLICPAQLRNT